VIVPVPRIVNIVILLYVPPEANVNELTFNEVVVAVVAPDTVLVLPVKFNELNQLVVVISISEAPLVNDKFGALVAVPPLVLPNR